MRIGVLIAGDSVAQWQQEALNLLPPDTELVVLKATSPGPTAPRRLIKHGAYYALNLLSMRDKKSTVLDLFYSARVIEFHPESEGIWSKLPDSLIQKIKNANLDAIVKFGLSLLRVPQEAELPVPILSYHHGDPREYRGRPAGFYETKHRRESVGQIVQQISNKLDAGRVLAFAETPVFPYSYRKTLATARALSPKLLSHALAALKEGRSEQIDPMGRNYRLPSNMSVLGFAATMGWEKVKRGFYGSFVEKKWQVSLMPASGGDLMSTLRQLEAKAGSWRTLDFPDRYTFIADPFFDRCGGGVCVEAMEAATGIGRIARIDGKEFARIDCEDHHLSYPLNFQSSGNHLVIPEMVAGGRQKIFLLQNGLMEAVGELDIDAVGLLDPTIFERDEMVYLFANDTADGPSVLRLWISDSLQSPFVEHPASPIKISFRGSRMAGPILEQGGKLYRTGQDFRRAYGDGMYLFEIEELTRESYRERQAEYLSFKFRAGPHTLDIFKDQLLFDWYDDKLSPFAGWRRLKAKWARRRRQGATLTSRPAI